MHQLLQRFMETPTLILKQGRLEWWLLFIMTGKWVEFGQMNTPVDVNICVAYYLAVMVILSTYSCWANLWTVNLLIKWVSTTSFFLFIPTILFQYKITKAFSASITLLLMLIIISKNLVSWSELLYVQLCLQYATIPVYSTVSTLTEEAISMQGRWSQSLGEKPQTVQLYASSVMYIDSESPARFLQLIIKNVGPFHQKLLTFYFLLVLISWVIHHRLAWRFPDSNKVTTKRPRCSPGRPSKHYYLNVMTRQCATYAPVTDAVMNSFLHRSRHHKTLVFVMSQHWRTDRPRPLCCLCSDSTFVTFQWFQGFITALMGL